jgi:thiamine pyrophosphate-dependent acetolactate synthase large subunit-like protein
MDPQLVSQAAQMPRLARTAIQTALGRGGVSVLVLPGDVLHRPAAHPGEQGASRVTRWRCSPMSGRFGSSPTG